MHRRQFMQMTISALAAGLVTQCKSSPSRASMPVSMDAAAFRAERRYVETRFGKIAYVERGAGKAALFLHGFPLNGYQWRGALERLSVRRRCLAPDFMALGHSQVAEGQSVAPDAQVAMLIAFLDRLAIPAVDVVASDMGGIVAQLLVARHPDRVRTLLLTNCDVEREGAPASVRSLLADESIARTARGLAGQAYSKPEELREETIDTYLVPLRRMPIKSYRTAFEVNALAGIEAALRRCTVPARIVWGMADRIFSPASAGYLDDILPESQGVTEIEGAKLFFPEEYPDLLADEARLLWGKG
ncbi:alpha/beta hydrolase [Pendulispora brunnea]|uniref:Alpha/beta hydrolase n=1 Tax=Pendulispora brunnea TaxID=2905690 RepID=A0ABZ2KAI2_9BACT